MTLVEELRQILGESGVGVFWSPQQINDALNEAQIELLATSKYSLATNTFGITSATELFSLASVPGIMIPQRIIGTDGKERFFTTQAQLERYNREWRLEERGTDVKGFVLWSADYWRPYPLLATGTWTGTAVGVGWGSEIGVDADELTDIDDMVRKAMVYRAAAMLVDSTMPDFAEEYESIAQDYEQRFREQVRGFQGHHLRRLRLAARISPAIAGDVRKIRQY